MKKLRGLQKINFNSKPVKVRNVLLICLKIRSTWRTKFIKYYYSKKWEAIDVNLHINIYKIISSHLWWESKKFLPNKKWVGVTSRNVVLKMLSKFLVDRIKSVQVILQANLKNAHLKKTIFFKLHFLPLKRNVLASLNKIFKL